MNGKVFLATGLDINPAAGASFTGINHSAFFGVLTNKKAGFPGTFNHALAMILHTVYYPVTKVFSACVRGHPKMR